MIMIYHTITISKKYLDYVYYNRSGKIPNTLPFINLLLPLKGLNTQHKKICFELALNKVLKTHSFIFVSQIIGFHS